MGLNVGVYDGTVAVSADCDENILIYEVQETGGGDYNVRPAQRLDYTGGSFAVTSIAMDGRRLVYTTLRDGAGSLFVCDRDGAGGDYALSRTLDLGGSASGDLFVYDAAVDGDAVAVAVGNDLALFTLDGRGDWGREPAGITTDGYFAGSRGSTVSMDGGRLFATSDREVTATDLSGCASHLAALAGEGVTDEEETGEESPGSASAADGAAGGTASAPAGVPAAPVTFRVYCLDVLVTFDDYADDTSWVIARGADGEVVASSSGTNDGVSSSDRVCLDPGEYEFAISDVYGDGMYVGFFTSLFCFFPGDLFRRRDNSRSLTPLRLLSSTGAANGEGGDTS